MYTEDSLTGQRPQSSACKLSGQRPGSQLDRVSSSLSLRNPVEPHRRIFTTATYLLPAAADSTRLPDIRPPRTPPSLALAQPTPLSASKFALPSLDFLHRQAGQSWPGTTGVSNGNVPPTHTLPTPPSVEGDNYKQEKRDDSYSMAAVLPPQGVTMSMPPLGASSLTSRRTATNNLPGPLELPVNNLTAKFGGPLSSSVLPTVVNGQPPPSSINALLTPPSNIPGESLSPMSSGSASASNPAAIGLPPYTPNGYWTQNNNSAVNSYMSGGASGQPQPTSLAQSWNSSATAFNSTRGRFSPSLTSLMRNGSSGSPGEQLPPPTYEFGALPPFPNSLTQTGAASPGHAGQQHAMSSSISSQSIPASLPPHSSPANASDMYLQKLPPTPGFYPTVSQQSQYPQYASHSPSVQSPVSASTPNSRISPINQPIQQFARPGYVPMGMPSTVMSNMHSPTQQMPMGNMGPMGPIFNSGHVAQMHMYGAQPGQQPVDRPFKCDQCPQSFNRNHDLKRHKRIHLAVKPFPCGHCDKSFSRKDALKVSTTGPTSACEYVTNTLYRDTSLSKVAARRRRMQRQLRQRRKTQVQERTVQCAIAEIIH